MPTNDTLRDNLAFVAEFGNPASGCHADTRISMWRFMESISLPDDLDTARRGPDGRLRMYELNEDGDRMAEGSPIGRCFAWLRANGYRFDRDFSARRATRGNFMPYRRIDPSDDLKDQTCWISSWGRVYVSRLQKDGGPYIAFDGFKNEEYSK